MAKDVSTLVDDGASNQDLSRGPLKDRRCRDIFCTVAWSIHLGLFFVAAFAGVQYGNPDKLYAPRDYKGDYCGMEGQWNDGADHTNFPMLVRTMNVTSVSDEIAKELLCSSIAEERLMEILSPADLDDYMCGCCKQPCHRCTGVYKFKDPASKTELAASTASEMIGFTDKNSASGLMMSGSLTRVMERIDRTFIAACVKSCDDVLHNNTADMREYKYEPFFDDLLRKAWKILENDQGVQEIHDAINKDFKFSALPKSLCNYGEQYCVPFPGVTFSEMGAGYCSFALSDEMKQFVGPTVIAMETGAANLGSLMGVLMDTLDVLAVVFGVTFVMGVLLLVLVRFFVGIFVWGAIFFIVVFTVVSGVASYVKAGQCHGVSMTESAQAYAIAASLHGQSLVNYKLNQYAGTNYSVLDMSNEGYTGNGADYVGLQSYARTGRKCQRWDVDTPHNISWYLERYPEANLTENYCRNFNDAVFIWCYTEDPTTRWEFCTTLDTTPFHQTCSTGYVIAAEWQRDSLRVLAVILWCCALIELILSWCLFFVIRRAIAVLKVGAMFVISTPQVIFVPILEAMVAFLWVMFWCFCASFALSQVPSDYTPTTFFATYADAFGTADVPGNCTDKWPPSDVWKYNGDKTSKNDPCSGNEGDTTGITPHCWGCSPPRYMINHNFIYLFFSFLWNNALLRAILECIIAGSAATWFFTPYNKSGSKGYGKIMPSVYNAFRYHFGSLCFGAFILALVQFIRACLKYWEKQAQQAKNRVMMLVFKALQYVMMCFERFIKFLNRSAYITLSITGESFCSAAWHGFKMILNNFVNFGTLFVLGKIINVVGMLFIMLGTGLIGFYVMQYMRPEVNPVAPVLVYSILGWLTGNLFIGVFNLAVDTILFCMIIVEEKGYPADDYVPPPMISIVRGGDGKILTE